MTTVGFCFHPKKVMVFLRIIVIVTINTKPKQLPKPKVAVPVPQPRIRILDGGYNSGISGFVSSLQSVNLNAPEASQNAHSISDNRGGRIELGLENYIKK